MLNVDNQIIATGVGMGVHFKTLFASWLSSPYNGTNNCWFPLAGKWPTWKWTWIWIPYGKIAKKCPRYFRRDSRGNPRDLNMCRTGRSAALSRGRKSMPPIRVPMRMSRDYLYDFTLIFRWSTFSSTVNLCNINCVICSDTHSSFGPPIVAQSMSCEGVHDHEMACQNWRNPRLYLSLPCNNLSKRMH